MGQVSSGFESIGISFFTLYCLGLPIHSILHELMSSSNRDALRLKYQSLANNLNWLAHTTWPDLSTAVSWLDQYQKDPSPSHLKAAWYVSKYLAISTKNWGIYFTLPINNTRVLLTFSCPTSSAAYFIFELGTTRCLRITNYFWITFNCLQIHAGLLYCYTGPNSLAFQMGPMHWLSECQTVTAGSSTEAEIYATDECIKFLLELVQILDAKCSGSEIVSLGSWIWFSPSGLALCTSTWSVGWDSFLHTKGLLDAIGR